MNNDAVFDALETQRIIYSEHAKKQRNDPHANLPTTKLTNEEHQDFVTTIFRENYPICQSLHSSWNLGNNMYILMYNFCKLRPTNLLLNENHGPNIATNMKKPILTFILTSTYRK